MIFMVLTIMLGTFLSHYQFLQVWYIYQLLKSRLKDYKLLNKLTKDYLLNEINSSNKPFILYKSKKGFDLYSDFSKKIILSNKNINKFLNKKLKTKKKLKDTDLFIGFFGYEILNNLIGIKLPKQKSINFPKGIFYKPESKVSLKENLFYKSYSEKKVDKSTK